MDEDERRRFALEQSKRRAEGDVEPIEFPEDDPRDLPIEEDVPQGGGRD
jgi:hypothetical protein